MIVGALDIERVCACEPEHDPILVVHANGVQSSLVTAERVQPVARRHPQILELRDGVDLIEFAPHDRPELTRNPAGRFAVDAVPDVPRRVSCERPDHWMTL